jgi:hypothetical protein
LREPVHIDSNAVAFRLVRQRLQQIDCAIEILLDGAFGGGVIQLLDLGNRVHRATV